LSQSKSGRTSAPRLPQALQTNRSSMSDIVRPLVGADRRRRGRRRSLLHEPSAALFSVRLRRIKYIVADRA
jgi:hypothetical protein